MKSDRFTERDPSDIEKDARHVAGLLRVLRDALRTGERNGGLDMEATEGAIGIVNDALDELTALRPQQLAKGRDAGLECPSISGVRGADRW